MGELRKIRCFRAGVGKSPVALLVMLQRSLHASGDRVHSCRRDIDIQSPAA